MRYAADIGTESPTASGSAQSPSESELSELSELSGTVKCCGRCSQCCALPQMWTMLTQVPPLRYSMGVLCHKRTIWSKYFYSASHALIILSVLGCFSAVKVAACFGLDEKAQREGLLSYNVAVGSMNFLLSIPMIRMCRCRQLGPCGCWLEQNNWKIDRDQNALLAHLGGQDHYARHAFTLLRWAVCIVRRRPQTNLWTHTVLSVDYSKTAFSQPHHSCGASLLF